MAVIEIEDLKNQLIEHFQDSDDDAAIEMIENISDTLDAVGTDSGSEWESKYKDLKAKYIERFKKKEEKEDDSDEETDGDSDEETEETEETTEDDIFKKKEEE